MILRYFIFLLLSCAIVFCITIFFRLGGHKSVIVEARHLPPLGLIATRHLGPYHQVNDSIVKVEEWARANNVPCTRTFGIYLDDPQTADESRLRSDVGCVLDGVSSLSLSEALPQDLSFQTAEDGRYVVALFEGAPSIGPFKVYPAVEDFIAEHRMQRIGPPMEIYSSSGERKALTEYRFRVE